MKNRLEKRLIENLISLKNTKGVNGDSHLIPLYDHLKNELVNNGKLIASKKIVNGPFTKDFDIVFSDAKGKHAIELKSISSSFGKSFNHRIEEMCGQALMAKEMFNLRSFSYVFVVNETSESVKKMYLERLNECGARLLSADLLRNFVFIRAKESGLIYENEYTFSKWRF